jgi:hypothetical protein
MRGQEGATVDGGKSVAALRSVVHALVEAGDGAGGGGGGKPPVATLRAAGSVVEASGLTGVSIAATAGVRISTVAAAASSPSSPPRAPPHGLILDAGPKQPVVIAGGVISGDASVNGSGSSGGLDLSGGGRIRLLVGGTATSNSDEITAIEVFPKAGGGAAVVKLAVEDLVVGAGDHALVLTVGSPAVGAAAVRPARGARVATTAGALDLEAPGGVNIDGREGPVNVSSGDSVDLHAWGGARLRLGGNRSSSGGGDAARGEGILLEAPGGSLRAGVSEGVLIDSGTARLRVSAEQGAAIHGGVNGASVRGRGDVAVVGEEGHLTLYGGGGAGLRAGGGDSTGVGAGAEVDLPVGGQEVRIFAPGSIALDAPLVRLGGDRSGGGRGGRGGGGSAGAGVATTIAAEGALELHASAGLRVVGGGRGGVTVHASNGGRLGTGAGAVAGGELSLTSGDADASGGSVELVVGHIRSQGHVYDGGTTHGEERRGGEEGSTEGGHEGQDADGRP